MDVIEFDGLPSMVWPYVQVMTTRKPLLAPPGTKPPSLLFKSHGVRVNRKHLARYVEVCGCGQTQTQTQSLPPAYLHVLAMPLHMRLFVYSAFPLKVLGLVQLRNVIRHLEPVSAHQTLTLSLHYDSLRETENGQEVDLVTRAHVGEVLVWEEVSTMLARKATPGKRPVIERADRNAGLLVQEATLPVMADTGRRYAYVSGDWNPIHLFDRTAQWFRFKQAVAHGMWSLARCFGQAQLPSTPYEAVAEFKLPVYLPAEVVFRQQRHSGADVLTLAQPKADRLHLAVRINSI